ncbi:MAG: hypothetical protein LUH63_02400 [Parabacteroides sp.]|nr:hypothetical protein [Parabacteroides sp.]
MVPYAEPESGKIALIQEILDINDIQDIDLLYKFREEFMNAQDNTTRRGEENNNLS